MSLSQLAGGEEVDCSKAIPVVLEINPHELKLSWVVFFFKFIPRGVGLLA